MSELPDKESLTVEFKSDRKRLSDSDLVETVVAMANTKGGQIFIGVEDDGAPSGLHADHREVTSLAALVGNRTRPSVSVRVDTLDVQNVRIARVEVPFSQTLIATTDGKVLQRRLKADGTPENVPLYPYEIPQRQSLLRLVDHSAQPLADATGDDLDPIERERLRNIIRAYNGEKALLDLSDDDLDGAMGLTVQSEGQRRPTLAGMLILGREASLRRLVPTHEAAFQMLEGTDVRVNDFFRSPLLKLIETFQERFEARNTEHEINDQLFRVPVPDYDRRAFREALVNAFAHRDYTMVGTVYLRMTDEGLSLSNPGGFVQGVTVHNLRTVEPRPRNPMLADVLKRIGLAERTGRGVDRIFEGMLRFGRPAPDYSETTDEVVMLRLVKARADVPFMRMIIQDEQRRGASLPLDALIVLAKLRDERRLDTAALADSLQRPEVQTRAVLERLLEAGLIDGHGTGRGRMYLLSAKVYRREGQEAAYVRQAGFDSIQQEEMVMKYVVAHGKIRRADVMELCKVNGPQAYRLLGKLVKAGRLLRSGTRRVAVYTRKG